MVKAAVRVLINIASWAGDPLAQKLASQLRYVDALKIEVRELTKIVNDQKARIYQLERELEDSF